MDQLLERIDVGNSFKRPKGWRLNETDRFLTADYIQHNPNVETGRQGFIDFFSKIAQNRVRPIPEKLQDLVSIQAEGDFVTLSFVWQTADGQGKPYTTTWFDMFRIENGKLAEHWDNAVRKQ